MNYGFNNPYYRNSGADMKQSYRNIRNFAHEGYNVYRCHYSDFTTIRKMYYHIKRT